MVVIGDFQNVHFPEGRLKKLWQSRELEIERFWDFKVHKFVADLENGSSKCGQGADFSKSGARVEVRHMGVIVRV